MASGETLMSATIFSIGKQTRYFSGLAKMSMLISRSLCLINLITLNLSESAISKLHVAPNNILLLKVVGCKHSSSCSKVTLRCLQPAILPLLNTLAQLCRLDDEQAVYLTLKLRLAFSDHLFQLLTRLLQL